MNELYYIIISKENSSITPAYRTFTNKEYLTEFIENKKKDTRIYFREISIEEYCNLLKITKPYKIKKNVFLEWKYSDGGDLLGLGKKVFDNFVCNNKFVYSIEDDLYDTDYIPSELLTNYDNAFGEELQGEVVQCIELIE